MKHNYLYWRTIFSSQLATWYLMFALNSFGKISQHKTTFMGYNCWIHFKNTGYTLHTDAYVLIFVFLFYYTGSWENTVKVHCTFNHQCKQERYVRALIKIKVSDLLVFLVYQIWYGSVATVYIQFENYATDVVFEAKIAYGLWTQSLKYI